MSTQWKELLGKLQIQGTIVPVDSDVIETFESEQKIQLPQSYKEFCVLFGAGEFGKEFPIAVPGFPKDKGKRYSLEHLQRLGKDYQEYQEYSTDPKQHERGVFFSLDITGSFHFFDPNEVTDVANNEYAVYSVFRSFELQRSADNFWDFITQCCLGSKHNTLIGGDAPPQLFIPAVQ